MHGQDGFFTYDAACGILLLAAYFGVVAVFSKNKLSFLLLLIGILTCHWFGLSRSGYFGKLLGYSEVIFVLGIFLVAKRPISIRGVAILALFSASTASAHFGLATALFLGSIGGIFLLLRIIYADEANNKFYQNLEDISLLLLLIGISITTLGILSLPKNFNFILMYVVSTPWSKLIGEALDVGTLHVSTLFLHVVSLGTLLFFAIRKKMLFQWH